MGRGWEVICYKARLQSFARVTKARGKMADVVENVDIIKCVALFYKLGAAPKDFIYFIYFFVNSLLDVKTFLFAGY